MRSFIFDAAREVRLESDLRTRVGAALARGPRIIGLASNRSGKSPAGSWTRHAEVRVTLNKNAEGADVYVYREHGLNGKIMNAKPCAACAAWLRQLGVKRVYYTANDETIKEMSLKW